MEPNSRLRERGSVDSRIHQQSSEKSIRYNPKSPAHSSPLATQIQAALRKWRIGRLPGESSPAEQVENGIGGRGRGRRESTCERARRGAGGDRGPEVRQRECHGYAVWVVGEKCGVLERDLNAVAECGCGNCAGAGASLEQG